MRPAVVFAWAVCAVAIALGLGGLALGIGLASDRRELLFTVGILGVMSVVYPVAGAFIASRKPKHVVGWLLCAAGLSMSVVSFAGAYGIRGHGMPTELPGADIAAWLASWVFVPALVLSGPFLLFLFPTGAPPSRRWRPVVLAVAVASVAAAVGYAFRPGRLAINAPIDNPFGVPAAAGVLTFLARAGDVLFPFALVLAAASMVVRYRAGHSDERQQLKWFAYAATAMVIAFGVAAIPLQPLLLLGWTVGSVALAALPIAVAIAVLRYRLYDIDLIINRTLVYIVLIGILGGLYTASIAFFQRVFVALTGNTSDAAIVITALVLAGVFTPIRKALDALVDRQFKPRHARDEPPSAPAAARGLSNADDAVAATVNDRLDDIERRLTALERGRRKPRNR